jgi:hypothetical protein
LVISNSFIIDLIDNSEEWSASVAYSVQVLIYFIISEYLPDYFALDYTFMMTYLKKEEGEQLSIDADAANVKIR